MAGQTFPFLWPGLTNPEPRIGKLHDPELLEKISMELFIKASQFFKGMTPEFGETASEVLNGEAEDRGHGADLSTRVHSTSMAAEHRMRPAQALWSLSTRCVAMRPPMDWPAAMQGMSGLYNCRIRLAKSSLSSTCAGAPYIVTMPFRHTLQASCAD